MYVYVFIQIFSNFLSYTCYLHQIMFNLHQIIISPLSYDRLFCLKFRFDNDLCFSKILLFSQMGGSSMLLYVPIWIDVWGFVYLVLDCLDFPLCLLRFY